VKSSAIFLGRHDVAGVMASHALFLVLMAWVGYDEGMRGWYYAGLLIATGFVLHQYRLIRGRDRAACFKAFLNNNWVGFAIFAGTVLDLYLRVR